MTGYQKISAIIGIVALAGMAACAKKTEQAQSSPGELRPAAAHESSLSAGSSPLKFAPREGWIEEKPSSSMRQAQYRLPKVTGDAEDAELVVFYFQGGGGGVQANIDRWISQFEKADGSPATDIAKTTRRTVGALPITIVDVSGTYVAGMGSTIQEGKSKPAFRMLAAVAETGSGPWFFKLAGPEKTVARWEKSFGEFIDALKADQTP